MQLTVAVMARPPIPGRCKTRLAASIGGRPTAALYAAMVRDVLAHAARLPAEDHVLLAEPGGEAALVDLVTPPWRMMTQRGDDLGERLQNAVTDLGSEQRAVAILGSDAPTLPIDSLATALEQMSPQHVVFGPAEDGGYWAVAVGAPEPRIFTDIPWSTELVYSVTRKRCTDLGLEVVEAAAWYDVDDHHDLARLVDEINEDHSRAPHCAAWIDARVHVPER